MKPKTKPEIETATINIPIALNWSSAFLCLFLMGIGFLLCYLTVVKTVEVPVEVEKSVYILNENYTCEEICELISTETAWIRENCYIKCVPIWTAKLTVENIKIDFCEGKKNCIYDGCNWCYDTDMGRFCTLLYCEKIGDLK